MCRRDCDGACSALLDEIYRRDEGRPHIEITVRGLRGVGKSYLIEKIEKFLATQENCRGTSHYSHGRITGWGEGFRTIKIVEKDH